MHQRWHDAPSLEPPCKGCRLGFDREEYEGKFWHVWEGRAYPCTDGGSSEQEHN